MCYYQFNSDLYLFISFCGLNVVHSNFITVENMTCATTNEASSKLLSTMALIWNSRRRQHFRFEFQLINKMELNYKLLRHMALNTVKTIKLAPTILRVCRTVAKLFKFWIILCNTNHIEYIFILTTISCQLRWMLPNLTELKIQSA